MYIYRIILQGEKSKDTATLVFHLAEQVDFAVALAGADQLRGSLAGITDANIKKETLTFVISEDNQLPADADCTDNLVISCHLNAPAEAEKLATIRVPAPSDFVWQPGGTVLDMTNALVVQYVQQVSQHALISDGESINVATGNDGMSEGWWRSTAKTLRG